jgi:ABC-type uncharacterized transport system permease subunit
VLDRLLKLIVTLTLLLFLVQAVIGVAARALAALLTTFVSSVAHAGSILSGIVVALLAVGLAVRTVQFIANRDPRAAREREARARAVRQRVRRPAEGVPPVESHAEVLDDPDPAIGEEERG